jgi:hypothetical protein
VIHIGGTTTFFTLKLAANPREVIAEAERAAKERISMAYPAFMDSDQDPLAAIGRVGKRRLDERYSPEG